MARLILKIRLWFGVLRFRKTRKKQKSFRCSKCNSKLKSLGKSFFGFTPVRLYECKFCGSREWVGVSKNNKTVQSMMKEAALQDGIFMVK
jgi:uncharacterized protein with PIN domain